jgi:hypothetical protein
MLHSREATFEKQMDNIVDGRWMMDGEKEEKEKWEAIAALINDQWWSGRFH